MNVYDFVSRNLYSYSLISISFTILLICVQVELITKVECPIIQLSFSLRKEIGKSRHLHVNKTIHLTLSVCVCVCWGCTLCIVCLITYFVL